MQNTQKSSYRMLSNRTTFSTRSGGRAFFNSQSPCKLIVRLWTTWWSHKLVSLDGEHCKPRAMQTESKTEGERIQQPRGNRSASLKTEKTVNTRGLERHLLCDQPEYDAGVRMGNSGRGRVWGRGCGCMITTKNNIQKMKDWNKVISTGNTT